MLPEISETQVIVIGAGLSGLAAAEGAVRAGRRVIVLEREPQVGGMSASLRRDGFVFDLGGHRFVPRRRNTRDYVQGFFPDKELMHKARRSRIHLKGRSFLYPPRFFDFLRHFGARTAADFVWEGVRASWRRRLSSRREESLSEWFACRFGQRLTQAYFAPYCRKLWGVGLSQLAADAAPPHLADKDMIHVLRDLLHGNVRRQEKLPAGHFYYPSGGIGSIAERMARAVEDKGGRILLGRRAERVLRQPDGGCCVETCDPAGKREVFVAPKLVATAPLPELVHMLHPQPRRDVLAAAASLRFRGMRFFNCMMDGPAVLPDPGLTVPEDRYIFFRVQEVSRWSPSCVPAPKTACVFEIPCQKDDASWKMGDDEMLERVVADMKEMGVDIRERVFRTFSVRRQ
ncbi:MAG: FAD-dependent oxidoreductase, partial [Deltaproteobacteria bacterium]